MADTQDTILTADDPIVERKWTVEDDVELLIVQLKDTGQLTPEQRARVAQVQDEAAAKAARENG